MPTEYQEFIAAKSIQAKAHGFTEIPPLHPGMFPHQRDVTGWALRLGKAAAFLGTGLGKSAREHEDERHICPLQLEVIRRAVKLWTNPGDTVWSPFAGIGSEGFVALEMGRKFIGSELKPSYFRQAHKNLAAALSASTGLFATDTPEEVEA